MLDAEMIGMLGDVLGGKSIDQAVEDNGRYQQAGLKHGSRLPKDMGAEDRATLEKAGAVFGEDEDLFVAVTLPEGWEIRPTDHYMWSDLVDRRGRKRGSIFYKPDFWDRAAHFRICRRFEVGNRPEGGWNNPHGDRAEEGYVKDCGVEVYVTGSVPLPRIEGTQEERWAAYEQREAIEKRVRNEAAAWLEETYPNWRDPAAYWDEDAL